MRRTRRHRLAKYYYYSITLRLTSVYNKITVLPSRILYSSEQPRDIAPEAGQPARDRAARRRKPALHRADDAAGARGDTELREAAVARRGEVDDILGGGDEAACVGDGVCVNKEMSKCGGCERRVGRTDLELRGGRATRDDRGGEVEDTV
jgi:hypothetical protein